jgi:RHS repeat-associated protein
LGTTTDSYSNDANGNTLSGGGRGLSWDGQNRLVQCTFGSTTTSHTYGSDGLRHRTVQGSSTTDYVLDGQSVVRTLLNGVVDRTYLHGARGPEYERIGNNAPLWYLYDGLGSVLGTIDQNGNLVQTRKYDVYGAVRASTGGSGTKHKFVGGLGHPSEDETGFIYMRARWMDPVTGRFVSEDPAKHGINWYSYVNANPITLVDISGRNPAAVVIGALLLISFTLGFMMGYTGFNPSPSDWAAWGITTGVGATITGLSATKMVMAVVTFLATTAGLGVFGAVAALAVILFIAGARLGAEIRFMQIEEENGWLHYPDESQVE